MHRIHLDARRDNAREGEGKFQLFEIFLAGTNRVYASCASSSTRLRMSVLGRS